jgi:hypothetical protein
MFEPAFDIPSPDQAKDRAYLTLLGLVVEDLNVRGMTYRFAGQYSDDAIKEVIKILQDKGWVASFYAKDDPSKMAGILCVLPVSEKSGAPVRIADPVDKED